MCGEAGGTGRRGARGLGTERSLDSRCVDQLHGLVDLEEGLEAWRYREEKGVRGMNGGGGGRPSLWSTSQADSPVPGSKAGSTGTST